MASSVLGSAPKRIPTVAMRFTALRRASGMTQGRLARLLDISRQAVNEIERGRVVPRISTVGRFDELEAKHQRARALSRLLASETLPWTRNITQDDNKAPLRLTRARKTTSTLKCA